MAARLSSLRDCYGTLCDRLFPDLPLNKDSLLFFGPQWVLISALLQHLLWASVWVQSIALPASSSSAGSGAALKEKKAAGGGPASGSGKQKPSQNGRNMPPDPSRMAILLDLQKAIQDVITRLQVMNTTYHQLFSIQPFLINLL